MKFPSMGLFVQARMILQKTSLTKIALLLVPKWVIVPIETKSIILDSHYQSTQKEVGDSNTAGNCIFVHKMIIGI